MRSILTAATLALVVLAGCSSAQQQPHELVYGRDWRLPSPTIEATATQAATSSPVVSTATVEAVVEAVSTPAPQATQSPTFTPPPSKFQPGALDGTSVRDVFVSAGWSGAALEQALGVSWCESRWQPGVVGSGRYLGLMQIDGPWFAHFGYSVADWRDPYVNASVALEIYSRYGWYPWECRA